MTVCTPAKYGEVTSIIKALAEGNHEPGQQLSCPAVERSTLGLQKAHLLETAFSLSFKLTAQSLGRAICCL